MKMMLFLFLFFLYFLSPFSSSPVTSAYTSVSPTIICILYINVHP